MTAHYGLTPRQKETLDFIKGYIEARGSSPTYDEIQQAVGLSSKSGVHRLVVGLCERGALWRMKHRHRSLCLYEPNSASNTNGFG